MSNENPLVTGSSSTTGNKQPSSLEKEIRVLVVDDSEFSRKNIIKVLEKEKINVVGEASNAQEAMNVIQTTNANILIIDVVMPDVNGIELTRHIHDNFANVHFIVISSLAQEHIILDAISAGASDFLHKPFSAKQIIDSVWKVASNIRDE